MITITSCTTCRGWSCMACVRAEEHAVCATDCPDCHDLRMAAPEPWDAPAVRPSVADSVGNVARAFGRRNHGAVSRSFGALALI